jgi:hypothetical protein
MPVCAYVSSEGVLSGQVDNPVIALTERRSLCICDSPQREGEEGVLSHIYTFNDET